MKGKIIFKILNIMLIAVFMILFFSNVVNATLTPGQLTGSTDVGTSSIQEVGNDVIGILTTIGVVLSVVILIVLGIKYMMGSAEEKAEYKKTMMPYIIGAALIFAASAIATVVYNFMRGISAT